MIKINLLSERKKQTPSGARKSFRFDGGRGARQGIQVAIVLLGVVVAGWMWWSAKNDIARLQDEHRAADQRLAELEEVRKKGDEYTARKELLERKIQLITELKRRQQVPVHILDQISRNLPDFLWLDSMNASQSNISIVGKATTYNAVSNFYRNLTDSGYFTNVSLGRTFEVAEGVSFSLTATFASPVEQDEVGGADGDGSGSQG
jgi:Tfp pilus assembly protein PilN